MIERVRLEHIVRAGVHAPSGDNSQPWSFDIRDDTVRIIAHPEMDHEILNVEGRGTYIATGALLENMVIAAEHDGLAADVSLFPEAGVTALMRVRESGSGAHPLFHAIEARHTHRGPYRGGERVELPAYAVGTCRARVIDDADSIRTIAECASVMEETALRTKKLHRLFFDSIIWSHAKNEAGEPGLYIKTTELPAPVQFMFRLIRRWPLMSVLSAFGFPKLAAHSNAEIYASSAACVLFVVERTAPADYIDAGRCMQRTWLDATRKGYAAQPLAGLLYLAEYIARTNDADIAPDLRARALAAREKMERIARAAPGTLAMILRVGIPHRSATARARRKLPHFI